ncbi:hypothetical protein DIPPA_10117 [Diplonema papillatum]|nr:hypothetical protein DIPPA_10117 [Diplonema papillatum]
MTAVRGCPVALQQKRRIGGSGGGVRAAVWVGKAAALEIAVAEVKRLAMVRVDALPVETVLPEFAGLKRALYTVMSNSRRCKP